MNRDEIKETPKPHPDLEREIDECYVYFFEKYMTTNFIDYSYSDFKADIKSILARAVKMPSEEDISIKAQEVYPFINGIPDREQTNLRMAFINGANYMKEGGK
jgi:hypothetical protein